MGTAKQYVIVASLIAGAAAAAAGVARKFPGYWVYADDQSKLNHFIPSGWMGDHAGLRMDAAYPSKPHSGKTSVKFGYKPSSPSEWVGVFWQDPANNWGEKDGGYDMTGARRLSFWARGEKGGEVLTEVKVGGIKGKFTDSAEASAGPIVLRNVWNRYVIDLKGKDLSALVGGFCWVADAKNNPKGLTFYIDDVRFE